MPDSPDLTPELRLACPERSRRVADKSAEKDRLLDIFLHVKAVAPDPAGDAIWVLLDRTRH